MTPLPTFITEKRDRILEIAHERGARNVRIFGSMARGEQRSDSDIDFLVDFEPGRSLLDQAGLLLDLRDLFSRRVDVVTRRGLHPELEKRVLAEARPL